MMKFVPSEKCDGHQQDWRDHLALTNRARCAYHEALQQEAEEYIKRAFGSFFANAFLYVIPAPQNDPHAPYPITIYLTDPTGFLLIANLTPHLEEYDVDLAAFEAICVSYHEHKTPLELRIISQNEETAGFLVKL